MLYTPSVLLAYCDILFILVRILALNYAVLFVLLVYFTFKVVRSFLLLVLLVVAGLSRLFGQSGTSLAGTRI